MYYYNPLFFIFFTFVVAGDLLTFALSLLESEKFNIYNCWLDG